MSRTPLLVAFVVLVGSLVGCEAPDPLARARELQAQGRLAESLEPLRELLLSHPDEAEVHYRYGLALRRTGQSGMAVWSLRKAGEDPDWEVAAGLELAAAASEGKNWTTAIEAASAVLEVDPDNVEALYLRGEALLSQKSEPEAALADFDRALALAPDSVSIELSRVAVLLTLNDVEAAGESIRRLEQMGEASALNPAVRGHFCAMQATFASESGELEQAESLFGDCLERYPSNPVVLSEALKFFDAQSRPDQADALLQAALERAPESLAHRQALAERLRAAGQFEESEALLRAGLELGGDALRADTWAALASHFAEQGDPAAAADAYEQALELVSEPLPGEILVLADFMARAGQHERALELSKRLDSDTYRGLVEARVHLNEGRPKQALDRLDEILPAWPNNAGARYYAARAAEQIGDFDRAIEEYRQTIRSEADLTDAGLRLARLHAAEGEIDRAWEAAFQYHRAHPSSPEGTVLIVDLAGRLGPESRLRNLLARLRKTPLWGRVVAERAEAVARLRGSEAAIQLLREVQGIDFTRPGDAPALRALVVHLLEQGNTDEALKQVGAALAAHPEEAAFHEIHARVLEKRGASTAEVRAAYERAVELDAKQAQALEGLAGLAAAAGDRSAALALYDRATQTSPELISAWRGAARIDPAGDASEAVAERWEALLREHPWDAAGALELAQLHLAAGTESDRPLQLAQQSLRFGGGPAARRLLAKIHAQRGEPERAAQILDSAAP